MPGRRQMGASARRAHPAHTTSNSGNIRSNGEPSTSGLFALRYGALSLSAHKPGASGPGHIGRLLSNDVHRLAGLPNGGGNQDSSRLGTNGHSG
jgi:cysteine sulfinate desulfinase/cysteine desulfurase-like protein